MQTDRSEVFIGRQSELAKLTALLDLAAGRSGSLMLVTGEPGVGKTSLLGAFSSIASLRGAVVLSGRCQEEWTPPFKPFIEALGAQIREIDAKQLSADLGYGAAPLARLIPSIRQLLPEIPEPAALPPDEEHLRVLEAVAQYLRAVASRTSVVVILDDLHWADNDTLSMLRHVARATREQPVWLVGAFRDAEVDSDHPLARVVSALRYETTVESLALKGLGDRGVGELLSAIAGGEFDHHLVSAVGHETEGNPFFVKELAGYLMEEDRLRRDAYGVISLNVESIADVGIPEHVRDVVRRRLSRLTPAARSLLAVASAFGDIFLFGSCASVAGLTEAEALDALDQALAASMLHASGQSETYVFSHAIIRHAIYEGMNPSRRARVHRRLAEDLERTYHAPSFELTATLVYQYESSASLPGSERGADHALAGAAMARSHYAWQEVARFLRAALNLMGEDDARREETLASLGRALVLSLAFDEAVAVSTEAANRIAVTDPDSASDYVVGVAGDMTIGGSFPSAFTLASIGMRFARERRDFTWAYLRSLELTRLDAEDPTYPGIHVLTPEYAELSDVIKKLPRDQQTPLAALIMFESRDEILDFLGGTFASGAPFREGEFRVWFRSGQFRRILPLWEIESLLLEKQGRIGVAARCYTTVARLRNALGDLDNANQAYRKARDLTRSMPRTSTAVNNLAEARYQRAQATGEGWERLGATIEMFQKAVFHRGAASARAGGAHVYAEIGRVEDSLAMIDSVIPAIERGAAAGEFYPVSVMSVAEALWVLGRTDHIETIQQNLFEKVVQPDFRYPMHDARRSMGHVCALQGREADARRWFAEARKALDSDGQRPLRALVDFDEARMYVRRSRRGDRARASPLLDAALQQFETIGMTGWAQRARDLKRQTRPAFPDRLTGREVEVLRLIAAGRTNTQISADLAMSERTVARHITNIYGKINARSKADATSYAIRHGLMTN
jgi:DNA-binding CsgD family transcriptional regulator